MGGRHARQGGEQAQPITRQSCYVTGGGKAEDNHAQTSEICCIDAHTSRIPNKGRILRKIPNKGRISSWSYSKVNVYRGSSVYGNIMFTLRKI